MGSSERQRELRRRRHRKKKLNILKRQADKGAASQRAVVAEKVRRLTPGAEVIITNWNLES